MACSLIGPCASCKDQIREPKQPFTEEPPLCVLHLEPHAAAQTLNRKLPAGPCVPGGRSLSICLISYNLLQLLSWEDASGTRWLPNTPPLLSRTPWVSCCSLSEHSIPGSLFLLCNLAGICFKADLMTCSVTLLSPEAAVIISACLHQTRHATGAPVIWSTSSFYARLHRRFIVRLQWVTNLEAVFNFACSDFCLSALVGYACPNIVGYASPQTMQFCRRSAFLCAAFPWAAEHVCGALHLPR